MEKGDFFRRHGGRYRALARSLARGTPATRDLFTQRPARGQLTTPAAFTPVAVMRFLVSSRDLRSDRPKEGQSD